MTGVTRTLVVILSLWPVIVAGCGSTSPDSERFKAGDRVDGIMGFAKVNGEVGWCEYEAESYPPSCSAVGKALGLDPALVTRHQMQRGSFYEHLHVRGVFDDDLNLVVEEVVNDPASTNPATGGTTTTTIALINGVATPMRPGFDANGMPILLPATTGATGGS